MTNDKINIRDVSIDAARGVALFLVALSHAHHNPHYVTDFYIMAFFFISGYLYKPGKRYGENIRKKVHRVLLPYFLNSLILLIVYTITKHFTIGDVVEAIKGVLYSRNYIYVSDNLPTMGSIANNPLWYLTAFFATSLLFHAVVDRFMANRRKTVLLCIVLLVITIALIKLPILLPWSLDMVPFFTIVMIIGYWFNLKHIDLEFNWLSTIIFFVAYMALCYENGSVNLSVRNLGCGGGINSLAVGLSGTLICISVCKKKAFEPFRYVFAKIGTNSIITLSYHLMFIGIYRQISRNIVLPLIGSNVENTYIYDLIIVIIAVVTCVMIGEIMDLIKRIINEKRCKA